MGSISAEARGVIRTEYNKARQDPEALWTRLSDRLFEKTQRFREGRRLEPHDLMQITQAVLAEIPGYLPWRDRYLYADWRRLGHELDDQFVFDDRSAGISAVVLSVTRRRVEISDYPLGIDFSAHALARLYERGPSGAYRLDQVLASSPALLPFLVLSRYLLPESPTLGVPWAGGLLICDRCRWKAQGQNTSFIADATGVGFRTDPWTVWSDGSADLILHRAATYLDADLLSLEGVALVRRWERLEQSVGPEIWNRLGEIALQPDQNTDVGTESGFLPKVAGTIANHCLGKELVQVHSAWVARRL